MLANSGGWAQIAGLAVVGALIILAALRPRQARHQTGDFGADSATPFSVVFLFVKERLVDATADAFALIGESTRHFSDYEATQRILESAFPEVRPALAKQTSADVRLHSDKDTGLTLDIHRSDDQIRLTLNATDPLKAKDVLARWIKSAGDVEKTILKDIMAHSPQLVWQADPQGQVLWANRAYSDFVAEDGAPFAALAKASSVGEERFCVTAEGGKNSWFDVKTHQNRHGFLHFADHANPLVQVEQARKDFVDALGRSFAQLSVGLAIFDKERRLVMFNPALTDMTGLPTDFLLPKPTIEMFLDRLREKGHLPEPKNYGSWREQFTALEAAAKDGTYCEKWSLPDGQTFRVTGRPHPDGAFAFLLEDISAEVSLTRRFRSDIETGQAVMDKLPDALAVFSGAGTLVISNKAYAKLWSTDDELMLGHRDFRGEISMWQDQCIPSPMWSEMRNMVQRQGSRKPWSDDAMLDDGRHIRCFAEPITGGMTMVRFSIAAPARPVIQKLTRPDPAIEATKR